MSLPQPVPPSWKDLGKNSADLLGKDYPVAGSHIEVKTKTPSNVTFKIAGDRDPKNLITGDIETKYTDFKNGLTLTQTWTTANALKTAVELENYGTNGLKLEVATSLHADKMAKGAVFSATYKQPGINSKISLDAMKGPTCTVETAFSHRGFVLGSEAAYNVGEGKVLRYGLGTCYNAPSYAATILALNNCKTFTASYYHRVSSDVEAGARATYDNKNPSAVNLEVGTKADHPLSYLDSAAFIKSKINSGGIASLAYHQTLRPGIKLALGCAVDTQKLGDTVPGPTHTMGLSLSFESS